MKNFGVKIFESCMTDEAYNKVKEEINKNPNFEINDDNITEFVDCKLVLDILKEHKIEYKIIAKDRWTTRGKIPQYDLIVCIYISQKDYVLIKYILEPENKFENEECDVEDDKITKTINLTSNILTNLLFGIIGLSLLVVGIQIVADNITTAIIFIIIGGSLLISIIIKAIQFFNNKFTKRL